jgi:hypothetical protein
MEQLTETDLTVLMQACDLQVRALRYGAERAEHEVEKLNFRARAERALSTQKKIAAALNASRNEW